MKEENKRHGFLITILIVIILLLSSLVGFFIYNDYYLKDNIKETNTEEKLSLSDARVINIEKKIDSLSYKNSYFYEEEKINSSDINYSSKIAITIKFSDIDFSNSEKEIYDVGNNNNLTGYKLTDENIETITENLKYIFGPDEKFITELTKSDCNIGKKDNDYIVEGDCEYEPSYVTLDNLQKAVKNNAEIKIHKKIGYILYSDFHPEIKGSVLSTDTKGKNIIAKIDNNNSYTNSREYYKEKMDENLEEFDTYVFTFKLDGTGNYYFYSSEKA